MFGIRPTIPEPPALPKLQSRGYVITFPNGGTRDVISISVHVGEAGQLVIAGDDFSLSECYARGEWSSVRRA